MLPYLLIIFHIDWLLSIKEKFKTNWKNLLLVKSFIKKLIQISAEKGANEWTKQLMQNIVREENIFVGR